VRHADFSQNPALTVALALVIGVMATAVARHARLPAIVLLLAMGVLLGPDFLAVVHPASLGPGLQSLVGFAVAVILFEGGLNLHVRSLLGQERAIRQLITLGALVTAACSTVAAHAILGWEWRVSLLFGTLVIVTGPTVITPLLRRLRVERTVATVLEAEGVFIDAVGAVVATVALEVALSASGLSFAKGLLDVALRLGTGAVTGVAGGVLLALLLRVRNLLPEGLENVFTLGWALALFQLANAIMPESGIAAVTVCGLVLGNVRIHAERELRLFKEQLTTMLIGMLFVLLAADIGIAEVRALGWQGLVVVAVLVFVVRPLNVAVGTVGTRLDRRQRLFIAWIAPRGIVAAAVSAFFAAEMERFDIAGGTELRALVFLVIACTVLWSGLTGGLMATLLGLKRPTERGWIILGAGELALAVARTLKQAGDDVVCVDTNASAVEDARAQGLSAVEGNGLDEKLLAAMEVDTRAGAIALTPNDEVNVLFVRRVKEEARLRRLYAALRRRGSDVERSLLAQIGGEVLFGAPDDVALWSVRLRRGVARVERWRLGGEGGDRWPPAGLPDGLVLPLALKQGSTTRPVVESTRLKQGDELTLAVNVERSAEVEELLARLAAQRVESPQPAG
jgi:NhaP-type Na+/H+ or K+/H+ antiporter